MKCTSEGGGGNDMFMYMKYNCKLKCHPVKKKPIFYLIGYQGKKMSHRRVLSQRKLNPAMLQANVDSGRFLRGGRYYKGWP